jgi:hypothetical protein
MYLFVYIYFPLKCNLLSCSISLSLHVSAIHSHRQVHVYLAETVSPCAKMTYRVYTRCCYYLKYRIRIKIKIKNYNWNFLNFILYCSYQLLIEIYCIYLLRVCLLMLNLVAPHPLVAAWVFCALYLRSSYGCRCSVIAFMLYIVTCMSAHRRGLDW